MRPYLAILKDSFREALVSRVLWILLVLATLTLAAIAPIGLVEQAAAYLTPRDIKQPQALVQKLRSEGTAAARTPAKQVWERLSDSLRQSLTSYPRPSGQGRPAWTAVNDLREELNGLLEDTSLYDQAAWSKVKLNEEAENLLRAGQENLLPEDTARLNRLLLEAAFPEEIAANQDAQLSFRYLGMKFGSPLPARKDAVLRGALTAFVNLFVGVLGVFAGILVTASIVPQTFEAGAIDLLLSKPISRVLLFLTKFAGGCAFIFITGVYFVGGLWLIVGLRFGLWSGKLLMCIPVFMFLFAIYYSVSVLAGVLWRNAIVCVVMTILFWGVCFAVGTAKVAIETVFLNPTRLVKIVPIEASGKRQLLGISEMGQMLLWDDAERNWDEIAMANNRLGTRGQFGQAPATIGPVFDSRGQRLLTIQSARGPLAAMGGGPVLLVGDADARFKQIEGPPAPDGPLALWVDDSGRIFALGASGIFRLEGDPTQKSQKVNVLGFDLPLDDKGGRFTPVSPKIALGPRAAAAVDPKTFEAAMYDHPRLAIYALRESGRYKLRGETKLEAGKSAVLALAGSTLLVAGENGTIRLLQAADFKVVDEFQPYQTNAPRFAAASPDGRYLTVLFHQGKLWLYDTKEQRELGETISGQGDLSAVTFDGDNRLLVADRLRRVTQYELDTLTRGESWQPRMETLELAYRYVVRPLYTLFPKPGELDNLVSYLLSEQETVAVGPEDNLGSARMKLNIWEPLYSSLAFLVVVLALGCVYVRRKDF